MRRRRRRFGGGDKLGPAEMLVHDTLRAEVRRISEAKNRTLTELSKEVGIPFGTFSGWAAGTYAGNVGRIDEQVQKWLTGRSCAARKRAELPTEPGFTLTPTAEAIMAVLEHAQHAPDLAMITGAAGVGKTSTIEAYRRRSTNVWVITGEPCVSTPRMLLDLVAEQLSVTEWQTHRVSRAVVAKMRGTRGLLVVDEAQHLTTPTLDQVRTLHDMSGVGIALVGNERVSSRIEGGSRSPDFAQLFSRVGMRLSKAKPTKGDVEALLDAWQIEDGEVSAPVGGDRAQAGRAAQHGEDAAHGVDAGIGRRGSPLGQVRRDGVGPAVSAADGCRGDTMIGRRRQVLYAVQDAIAAGGQPHDAGLVGTARFIPFDCAAARDLVDRGRLPQAPRRRPDERAGGGQTAWHEFADQRTRLVQRQPRPGAGDDGARRGVRLVNAVAETGESTRSIHRGVDDRAWLLVQPLLAAGGRLQRVSGTRRYYVGGSGGISDAGIRRFVAEGKIRPFLDSYVLAEPAP